jgi:hypothetical protein
VDGRRTGVGIAQRNKVVIEVWDGRCVTHATHMNTFAVAQSIYMKMHAAACLVLSNTNSALPCTEMASHSLSRSCCALQGVASPCTRAYMVPSYFESQAQDERDVGLHGSTWPMWPCVICHITTAAVCCARAGCHTWSLLTCFKRTLQSTKTCSLKK